MNGKINVWKCKLIFPTDTLQQQIEMTDLKLCFACENTSVLIILATTVYILQIKEYETFYCKIYV